MKSFLPVLLGACLVSTSFAQDRPNIILMMADDLGWGDPSYNSGWINTPALDAMAAEGLRFDRFYSASAVCSPTRASCLTGRHPHRLGITNANTGRLAAEETPLSEVLNGVGYATGHFGKWHLGTMTTLRSDSNRGASGNTGDYSPPWQHQYDFTFATEAKVPTYHPMRRTINGLPEPTNFSDPNFYGTRYWTSPSNLTAPEGLAVSVTNNLSGDDSRVIMDRVIPFIQDAVADAAPFFTVIWFHTPHKPLPDPDGNFPVDSDEAYTTAIIDMDTQIARLRTELQTLGVKDKTMFWFCSDNGPEDGVGSAAPFRARKRSLHEGGVRVPGILVWPEKITTPRTTSFPSVTSDYYPTILDYLDLEVPNQKPIDGLSLRGVIENTATVRTQPIGFNYLAGRSWVNQQHKLISKDNGNTFELYDLLADPSEQSNIANDHPEIVAQMTEEFQAWSTAVTNDTEYLAPEERVTALLSTLLNVVNGPFEVAVNFSENTTGLTLDDFIITNGIINALAGNGSNYTLTLTPTVGGIVTLQLPADSVLGDENKSNLSSNTLGILFSTSDSPSSGTILLDDHFDDENPAGWISQGNPIATTTQITEANSLLEISVNASAANSNRGLASVLAFDPSLNNGFTVTFVVDSLDQRPEVNGYFLGIVGDNSVFYRDANTRNFGLTFFGTESRTNSESGFGLNFGDNFGASGASLRLADSDLELASFLDGFTATISADLIGWNIMINGLNSPAGSPTFLTESGTWAASGTTFSELFGNDGTWHLVTSNQRVAPGIYSTSFDRIQLTSGPIPPPRIVSVQNDPETDKLSIAWQSLEGRRYQVERSLDLKNWTIIEQIDADGPLSSFTDQQVISAPTNFFYRITLLGG